MATMRMHTTRSIIWALIITTICPFWLVTAVNAIPPSELPYERLAEAASHAAVSWTVSAAKDSATRQKVGEVYGRLPMRFEANIGQVDPRVKFMSRGAGYNLFLSPTQATFALFKTESSAPELAKERTDSIPSQTKCAATHASVLSMNLIGANTAAEVKGLEELPGKNNYFIGSDPKKWRRSLPTYAKVKYKSVYPGIDVVFYGNQRQLEYDFYVAPGADLKAIRMRFDGTQRLRLASNGDLVIESSYGEIRQHRPVIYQEEVSGRREVPGRYLLTRNNEIAFEIWSYDKSKPLVIDPLLTYSTYLGGPLNDEANAIAVDSAGNAYIAGNSNGRFPRSGGGFSNRQPGAFVAKMNPAGTHLLYSAVLESGNAYGIAVDLSGNAYVTGLAFSSNFPTTTNAFARSTRGGRDVFVTKLNPEGNDLAFSTLIGGENNEQGNAIAIDAEGAAYITGETFSRLYPTENPLRFALADDGDFSSGDGFKPQLSPAPPHWAFVTKVNPGGSRLVYSTYLANVNSVTYQTGYGIAVDSAGHAHVTGTITGNLVTTPGAFQRANSGSNDAFIVKLATDGASLIFSTYLGGSGYDEARAIGLDDVGNVYVAGRTQLTDFPTTPGVLQPHNSDSAFIKSTDKGITWSPISKGLHAAVVNYLVSAPSPTSNIYALQNGDTRLFRSSDQGATWTAATPPTQGQASAFVVDPSNPLTLYVGLSDSPFSAARGVVKSTDGGDTWKRADIGLSPVQFVTSLDVDPSDSSIVYAGSTGSGVFKSTDGGNNWTGTGLPIGFISSLAVDPKTPSTVYAASGNVLKSTDGGNSWKATGRIDPLVSRVVIDPAKPSTVYALTQTSISKSIDGGDNWRFTGRILPGLEFLLVNSLAIDPQSSATLYVATHRGIYKSVDGGDSWNASGFVDPGTRNQGFYMNTIAVDRVNSLNIYAGGFARAEAFVTKLNSTGSQLIYSTYLGGIGEDVITGLALDGARNVSVVGYTDSPSFPTTVDGAIVAPGIDNSRDAFIAKLNVTGSALTYSTYLGTLNFDTANALAVDALGNIYLAGTSSSLVFPTTMGAFQQTKPGQNSGFIVKVSFLKITNASISGKKLIVTGEGFDRGAVIVIDGTDQKTQNDGAAPSSVLIAKKGGKKIVPGQKVLIQVRNPDGTLSDGLSFTRAQSNEQRDIPSLD